VAPENIHTPNARRVSFGNSRGKGDLKSQELFERKRGDVAVREGGGGFKPKIPLWEGYEYFLEQQRHLKLSTC